MKMGIKKLPLERRCKLNSRAVGMKCYTLLSIKKKEKLKNKRVSQAGFESALTETVQTATPDQLED